MTLTKIRAVGLVYRLQGRHSASGDLTSKNVFPLPKSGLLGGPLESLPYSF